MTYICSCYYGNFCVVDNKLLSENKGNNLIFGMYSEPFSFSQTRHEQEDAKIKESTTK